MKLLLDTHTFLWLVEGSPNLSAPAQIALADPANQLYLSSASIWEIVIKTSNKRLVLTDPVDIYVHKWTTDYQLGPLPIYAAHALRLANLPDHHRDPFDRILIAQAFVEGMTLVSADAKFAPYAVPILW
ncbi:MAG: type II toxin-antitoxin system VapC family toxin [Planctomycetes bacterium]|nr:type II toxin-antitoxin system VapC family toxin [Planctomycetota bacterium]